MVILDQPVLQDRLAILVLRAQLDNEVIPDILDILEE